MKTTKYITIALLGVTALACNKTEFDDFDSVNGGSANFSNYIAVGNSLTQGYQDNGLHNEYNQQDNSFPAIIAKQMGVNFVQPTVLGANGSGYLRLTSLKPTLLNIPAASGWNNWDKNIKYNNLGVSGIRLTDCVPTPGGFMSATINQVITDLNPYGKFLDFGSIVSSKSYLDNVKNSGATFFTCWLGNNDVLGWATAGGDDGEITIAGIPIPIKTSNLTDPAIFRSKYDSILGAFQTMGAKGVCATIPDVTSIPFFTTVPHNPVPLDQQTVTMLNSSYAAYNGGIDLALANSLITPAEAASRKINFTVGSNNKLVIIDEDLTDLTGLNSALINIRQATSEDLIVLKASSDIGRVLNNDPTKIYGVSIPFADSLVLTKTEVLTVQNHTNLLNNEIRASASAHGVAIADMHSFLFTLRSGLVFDGVAVDAKFIEGGAFSLDGVHPNSRGYAMVANKFIEVINNTYGSNIRPVPIQNYRGIIFP